MRLQRDKDKVKEIHKKEERAANACAFFSEKIRKQMIVTVQAGVFVPASA